MKEPGGSVPQDFRVRFDLERINGISVELRRLQAQTFSGALREAAALLDGGYRFEYPVKSVSVERMRK